MMGATGGQPRPDTSPGRAGGATVFVMTDVVGSTALWETHREAMGASLELHDQVVHGAMEAAGGRVFKHTGDGMIAAFDDADAAVAAGLAGVEGLASQAWGATGPLRVRVSVHAGVAMRRGGDFFGPPVNRVARINGVGTESQVLVSDDARNLMTRPLQIDLGEHQLRDLAEPVRLWQADEGDHPPIRSLGKARHNLPRMATEFVGRRDEIAEIRQLVHRHPWVTLAGIGGCGKTRLAVEVASKVADSFPGGVWFVDLSTERDGSAVGDRALAAMGLARPSETTLDAVDALDQAVGGRSSLLVVDNCEHLIDDVASWASDVLQRVPAATVLATSREAIAVDGEHVWPVPDLRDGSVELFVARARAAGAPELSDGYDQIDALCARLDHIPLAIELAAAQAGSLSLADLAARLDDRLEMTRSGSSGGRRRPRGENLQTMMDWSYGLLDADEQTLLGELAVFAGSFPLAGVEAVSSLRGSVVVGALQSLVRQSLVVALPAEGRYRLLETVRVYGLARLEEAGGVEAARDRHLRWMVAVAGETRWLELDDDQHWDHFAMVRTERANVLAAMEWGDSRGATTDVCDLFLGGAEAWASDPTMGRAAVAWLARIPAPGEDEPYFRAAYFGAAAILHASLGNHDESNEFNAAAGEVLNRMIADDPSGPWAGWSSCLGSPAIVNVVFGNLDAARAEADRLEVLAEGRSRDRLAVDSTITTIRAMAAARAGSFEELPQMTARLVEIATRSNSVALGMARAMHASAMLLAGRPSEALDVAADCLGAEHAGQNARIHAMAIAVAAAAELGRYDDAIALLDTDFGPMLEAQQQNLAACRLTGLIAVLEQLRPGEQTAELTALALVHHRGVTAFYLDRLGSRVGGIEALFTLPPPRPEWLKPEGTERLIEDLKAEVRTAIHR